MAFRHVSERSNVKMSDMIKVYTGVTSPTSLSMKKMYSFPRTNTAVGYIMTPGSGHRTYSGFAGSKETAYGHPSTNPARVLRDGPLLFTSQYGRYASSSTASPTNMTPSLENWDFTNYTEATPNVPLSFSQLTGTSDCCLTTDRRGQSRSAVFPSWSSPSSFEISDLAFLNSDVGNGVTSGSSAAMTPGGHGYALASEFAVQTSSQGASTTGINTHNIYPGRVTTSQRQYDVEPVSIGYSIYQSRFTTNKWITLKLNTVCAGGDRVLVIAQSGGGTMYTFSNNSPIGLRTASDQTISGTTVQTHYGPTHNTTGTNDWVAVYSAVCGSAGGATNVIVNPYHSGNMTYMWHVFVIKGPNSQIQTVSRTKAGSSGYASHTATNFTAPSNSVSNGKQHFGIGCTTSPFANNGWFRGISPIGQSEGFDVHCKSVDVNRNKVGAYYTSIASHNGGHNFPAPGSKAGPSWQGYNMQYGQMRPNQDSSTVVIKGFRGA